MKVVILHQHFNTPEKGGAIRSYYLAKALLEGGIETVVVTAHAERRYRREFIEGIEVHYLPIAYNNRFGFYKRGISFIRYAIAAFRLVSKLQPIDFCYAMSVPLTVGLTAIWIKNRLKVPFLFDVGDLWPDAPVQMGFIQNKLLKESLYRLEKRIYNEASAIVALSPMIQASIARNAPGKTIHMISNMADTEFYKPELKSHELQKKFNVSGKFVVSYIGALGYANGLDYYLECARESQKAQLPVHFLLCGDGGLSDHLKSSAKQLMLQNLSFVNFQNRNGVRELMNVTDATFICYRPVPILETGSPNKFFDGLAAGKLIIINFGGWIKEEILNNQCGIYVDPKSPAQFVSQMKPFVETKELLDQYRANSRQLAMQKYSRKQLSIQFASLFKN